MAEFGIDLEEVNNEGERIKKLGEEFYTNRKKIDEIIQKIGYKSEEATAIATKIRSYNPLLEKIQNKINNHGEYAKMVVKRTMATQDSIKSRLNKNM